MVIALSAAFWLLALGCWLAAGAGPIAHAALTKKVPASHASPATRVHPPAEPDLSITVTDGRTAAKPGDRLSYVVKIKNAGGATARNLRVTLTFPPYLSMSSASQQENAKAGKLTWLTSVRPGHAASFTISAVVGRTPRGIGHLAVVACAEQHKGTPVICAAHLDRLPGAARTTAGTSRSAHGTAAPASAGGSKDRYVFAGLAVLACILLAALAAGRLRARKHLHTPTPGYHRRAAQPQDRP
jgi:uncharacterized repeat protein (TIGR01451 family)